MLRRGPSDGGPVGSVLLRKELAVGAAAIVALAAVIVPRAIGSAATAATVLTGIVTNAAGAPLAGIDVSAVLLAGSSDASETSTTSGGDGSFSFDLDNSGQYLVRFVDSSGTYSDQYYLGSSGLQWPSPVTVAAGQTTTVSMVMVTGGSITGSITSAADGSRLDGVCVAVASAGYVYTELSAPDGSYSFAGLAAPGTPSSSPPTASVERPTAIMPITRSSSSTVRAAAPPPKPARRR